MLKLELVRVEDRRPSTWYALGRVCSGLHVAGLSENPQFAVEQAARNINSYLADPAAPRV